MRRPSFERNRPNVRSRDQRNHPFGAWCPTAGQIYHLSQKERTREDHLSATSFDSFIDSNGSSFAKVLSDVLWRIQMHPEQLSEVTGLGDEVLRAALKGRLQPFESEVLRLGLGLLLDGTKRKFLNRLLQARRLLPLPPVRGESAGQPGPDGEGSWLSGARLKALDRPFKDLMTLIRNLRATGISQARLARRCGVDQSVISRLKWGKRMATEVFVLRLGAALLLNHRQIKFLNRLLEAAWFDPLPVPGVNFKDNDDGAGSASRR